MPTRNYDSNWEFVFRADSFGKFILISPEFFRNCSSTHNAFCNIIILNIYTVILRSIDVLNPYSVLSISLSSIVYRRPINITIYVYMPLALTRPPHGNNIIPDHDYKF